MQHIAAGSKPARGMEMQRRRHCRLPLVMALSRPLRVWDKRMATHLAYLQRVHVCGTQAGRGMR